MQRRHASATGLMLFLALCAFGSHSQSMPNADQFIGGALLECGDMLRGNWTHSAFDHVVKTPSLQDPTLSLCELEHTICRDHECPKRYTETSVCGVRCAEALRCMVVRNGAAHANGTFLTDVDLMNQCLDTPETYSVEHRLLSLVDRGRAEDTSDPSVVLLKPVRNYYTEMNSDIRCMVSREDPGADDDDENGIAWCAFSHSSTKCQERSRCFHWGTCVTGCVMEDLNTGTLFSRQCLAGCSMLDRCVTLCGPSTLSLDGYPSFTCPSSSVESICTVAAGLSLGCTTDYNRNVSCPSAGHGTYLTGVSANINECTSDWHHITSRAFTNVWEIAVSEDIYSTNRERCATVNKCVADCGQETTADGHLHFTQCETKVYYECNLELGKRDGCAEAPPGVLTCPNDEGNVRGALLSVDYETAVYVIGTPDINLPPESGNNSVPPAIDPEAPTKPSGGGGYHGS